LTEWEANKEEVDREVCFIEVQEKVVEDADEGELLVLRRALSGIKGDKEEQWENIFHSRCTGQGKSVLLVHRRGELCEFSFH